MKQDCCSLIVVGIIYPCSTKTASCQDLSKSCCGYLGVVHARGLWQPVQLSGHLLTLCHIFRAVVPIRQQPVRKLLGHAAVHCLRNRSHQLKGLDEYFLELYDTQIMTPAQGTPDVCCVLTDLPRLAYDVVVCFLLALLLEQGPVILISLSSCIPVYTAVAALPQLHSEGRPASGASCSRNSQPPCGGRVCYHRHADSSCSCTCPA